MPAAARVATPASVAAVQDEHLAAAPRQLVRHREPDDAPADDDHARSAGQLRSCHHPRSRATRRPPRGTRASPPPGRPGTRRPRSPPRRGRPPRARSPTRSAVTLPIAITGFGTAPTMARKPSSPEGGARDSPWTACRRPGRRRDSRRRWPRPGAPPRGCSPCRRSGRAAPAPGGPSPRRGRPGRGGPRGTPAAIATSTRSSTTRQTGDSVESAPHGARGLDQGPRRPRPLLAELDRVGAARRPRAEPARRGRSGPGGPCR